MKFLGHRVSGEKVCAIRDWPAPNDQSQLKAFPALVSYYNRLGKEFSCIAAPLFRLLCKNQPFSRSADCLRAFTAPQQALIHAPVLTSPDPTLPSFLDTDVSVGRGKGRRGSVWWRTSKSEWHYCGTRWELYYLYKYYLWGIPFTIRTDHAALQWLMTFQEPEG